MTAPSRTSASDLSEPEIRQMVVEWYRSLDRHDDVEDVLPFLVDDGLELRFPETTEYGHTGFRNWYATVCSRFFDEEHTVTGVAVDRTGNGTATLTVDVNWQARIWDPPAPRSTWIGFDSNQTWNVVRAPDGRPQVTRYVVNSLAPMPGSPTL